MALREAEPVPTVLGVLVIGRSPADWLPGAYTQFLRLDGIDLTAPVVDEAVIHGTVADQIRRLEEKLEAHNLQAVRFAELPREVRTDAYPMEALRQLVRKARMHRSFEATNAPVKVYWFNNRIEIHNPGAESRGADPLAGPDTRKDYLLYQRYFNSASSTFQRYHRLIGKLQTERVLREQSLRDADSFPGLAAIQPAIRFSQQYHRQQQLEAKRAQQRATQEMLAFLNSPPPGETGGHGLNDSKPDSGRAA